MYSTIVPWSVACLDHSVASQHLSVTCPWPVRIREFLISTCHWPVRTCHDLSLAHQDLSVACRDLAGKLVPSDVPNHSDGARGEPLLTTHSFSEGDLPVISFDGDDGFTLSNDSDLYLTEQLSVFAVVIPLVGQEQIVISNYKDTCGFGLGVSDNMAQELKWFTANPIDSLESE